MRGLQKSSHLSLNKNIEVGDTVKLDKIESLIDEKIKSKGFELEYIEFVKEGDNNILRVVIDKKEDNVSIDDCENISRLIEDDIDKNINKEYILEVSSAGLERQLKNIKLYKKYMQKEIYVKLYKKQEYGKEIIGILEEVDEKNNKISVGVNNIVIFIDINDIATAHTIYDFDNAFKNKDNVNINELKKF